VSIFVIKFASRAVPSPPHVEYHPYFEMAQTVESRRPEQESVRVTDGSVSSECYDKGTVMMEVQGVTAVLRVIGMSANYIKNFSDLNIFTYFWS
jgi:hypothetical protein